MFTAIVTTHNNRQGLDKILKNLFMQSEPPTEIIVVGSDTDFFNLPDGIKFILDENRNDWGHNKRAIGVKEATGDYLGFFNDDDSYHLDYCREMLEAVVGSDVAFCGWNTYHKPSFSHGSSTSGNFIVKTDLAKKVGYNHRVYDADGLFINEIKRNTDKIVFVNKVLYYHNVQ
jgi:glycosyltransferase involved in cell wall biosynthesis